MSEAEGAVQTSVGKVLVTAAVAGTIAMLVIGVGITLLAGGRLIDALGIGVFTAVWGGPGFGGMAGGIYYVTREEHRTHVVPAAA